MNFNKIIKAFSLILIIAAIGTGCKKDDFAINRNPNSITASTASYREVFPAALQSTSTIVDANWKFLQDWLGFWARSGDFQSITDEETYTFTNDFQSAVWVNLYANATNYDYVVKNASAVGAGIYSGAARIMRAHAFQMLVDVYGDIPYKDALKGSDARSPAYDKGLDIYKDLFRQLDTAIADLKNPAINIADKNPEIATNDFVYQGNTTNWIRLANTLKLRMLMHVYAVTSFDVTAEIAKITAEGSGYIVSGGSAVLNPGFSTTKPGPFYRNYVANEAGTATGTVNRANKYAIDYYNYDGDPRIDYFYNRPSATPTAAHKGIDYGTVANTSLGGTTLSTVYGKGLIPNGAASRAWIFTSVESLFLQTEARARGFITTGPIADSLFKSAVRESFLFLNVTTNWSATSTTTATTPIAAANLYMSNNAGYSDVDFTTSTNKYYTIGQQKWFALNTIAPFEIWSDYRRINLKSGHTVYGGNGYGGSAIGFAEGPPISVLPGNTKTEIPIRLLYPQSEYNYNGVNVAKQGTINVFTSKVFWDVN